MCPFFSPWYSEPLLRSSLQSRRFLKSIFARKNIAVSSTQSSRGNRTERRTDRGYGRKNASPTSPTSHSGVGCARLSIVAATTAQQASHRRPGFRGSIGRVRAQLWSLSPSAGHAARPSRVAVTQRSVLPASNECSFATAPALSAPKAETFGESRIAGEGNEKKRKATLNSLFAGLNSAQRLLSNVVSARAVARLEVLRIAVNA